MSECNERAVSECNERYARGKLGRGEVSGGNPDRSPGGNRVNSPEAQARGMWEGRMSPV